MASSASAKFIVLRIYSFVVLLVTYSDGSLWPRVMAALRMRENKHHVPETVERSLDSTLDSVDSAEELALGVAQRAGFDEDDLMKIGMAVRESMVNAVVHGNRYNAHKKVRFSWATIRSG